MRTRHLCFLCWFAWFLNIYWIGSYLFSSTVYLLVQNQVAQSIRNTTLILNDNVTILIGISPNKCGSSYFHFALDSALRSLRYHALQGKKKAEVKYWDRCIIKQCDFKQYLHLYIDNIAHDLNTTQYKYNTIILFEKTTVLLRLYHSAYLLAHYSQSYSIYIYASLRDPASRTWSQYWMHRRFMFNRSNSADINKMIDKISSDFASFAYSYPKYQKVLDFIRITNVSNAGNDDIDEEKLVELYVDASYDFFNNLDFVSTQEEIDGVLNGEYVPVHAPVPMISCYYPQVLMWYHMFTSFNIQNRVKFFQFEWLITDINQVLKELLVFISANDTRKINEIRYHFERHHSYLRGSGSNYIPRSVQLRNMSLLSQMNRFYPDCNVRLYWFFEQHPELLLLQNMSFRFQTP